jgi:Uma2 family endonuclease
MQERDRAGCYTRSGTTMTTRVRLTYEDYAALPDDGRRYELHEGELSVTPAPGTSHQDILGNLFVILRGHVNTNRLGKVFVAPVDCIFENITIVQPDIVFVETARRSVISERGIEGAPTLVVEVISPSTSAIDRRRKLQLYARYAVPYYWIVDPPARTIEAYELAPGVYEGAGALSGTATLSLAPFPDLILDPQEIWRT